MVSSSAVTKHIDYEGGIQMRWGWGTSTVDGDQSFAFGKAFSNTCQSVQITRRDSGTEFILPVTACSKSSFTINRNNDINGSQDFYYMAMGF